MHNQTRDQSDVDYSGMVTLEWGERLLKVSIVGAAVLIIVAIVAFIAVA